MNILDKYFPKGIGLWGEFPEKYNGIVYTKIIIDDLRNGIELNKERYIPFFHPDPEVWYKTYKKMNEPNRVFMTKEEQICMWIQLIGAVILGCVAVYGIIYFFMKG